MIDEKTIVINHHNKTKITGCLSLLSKIDRKTTYTYVIFYIVII